MIYFTSDTHFGDWSILPWCKCPMFEDPAERDKLIVDGLRHLTENDTLYHLGDVAAVCPTEQNILYAVSILEVIPCKKILVMGNHDSEYPESVSTDPVKFWMNHGFHRVYDRSIIMDPKEHGLDIDIRLDHIPPMFSNDPHLYLFGHIHTTPHFKTVSRNTACVCSDRWMYHPISLNEVIERVWELRRSDTCSDVIVPRLYVAPDHNDGDDS